MNDIEDDYDNTYDDKSITIIYQNLMTMMTTKGAITNFIEEYFSTF